MGQVSDTVRAFFEDFNRANNSFEPELRAPLVGDSLVGADPNGVVQLLTKEEYLAGTAQSQEYLQSLGFKFVTVVPTEEVPLTDRYTMVKTKGTMRLEKVPGQPIDLAHDATYILYIKDGKPQIVFALSHEDPMKMAQDQHGVVFEDKRSWDETLEQA
ncbi:hypothetical protein [Ktedonospora formicarum]|uniref:Uncharacterized protein n=1 Tax=Ktedonospora formicarum TaxID=2778364 RepID=A0A8J3I3K7_9CHLR|nr:hypothetical protein [Ktedonospora formicarum]GHO46133.1 hypothetical protein KSX_42960 [Ktedonospora formicarum]